MVKKTKERRNKVIFLIIFLCLSSFLPFIRLLTADFVAWDDEIYVTTNAKVVKGLTLENVKWAFSTTYFGFYYPITWLSHIIDVELYKLNPEGHHLTSLILHILNTILLFLFLKRGGIDEIKSFIISALFSVHPLTVESVGWISERKNLLSFFFFFLSLNLYLNYLKKSSVKNLILLFITFLLGLMSKSVVVTFPVILYLIDAFPLNRLKLQYDFIKNNFWKLIYEKLIFFIPVPIFGVLTIVAQKEINALTTFDRLSWSDRIAGAILAYARYIYQFLFPIKLTAFYPHLRGNYSPLVLLLSILLLTAFIIFSIYKIKKTPVYFAAFFFFVINLLPVIGILQVGEQGSADRYMYIPIVGLLIFFVFLIYEYFPKLKFVSEKMILSFFLVVFLLFCFKTFNQTKVWLNSENLFKNMVEESPNPSQGYINIGLEYKKEGDYLTAIKYYKMAIEADPQKASAYNNLGSALYQLKDLEGANEAFKKACELNPYHSVMVYNLALSYDLMGKYDEAERNYLKALKLNNKAPSPRKNLINIYLRQKRLDESLKLSLEGERLINYDPYFFVTTALIYSEMGEKESAKQKFESALSKFGENYDILLNYGNYLYSINEFDKAEDLLGRAVKIEPKDVASTLKIVDIEISKGRIEIAKEIIKRSLNVNPDDPLLLKKLESISQEKRE